MTFRYVFENKNSIIYMIKSQEAQDDGAYYPIF